MKKILSVFLCIVMLITLVSVSFTGFSAYSCNCGVTPIIYIKGRTNIYKDPSLGTDSENMAETNFSGGKDAIIDTTANILPAFAIALATDEWDDYCDILFEEIKPIYDQYKLNNDGEIDNKSGIDEYWQIDNLINRMKREGIRTGHTHSGQTYAQYIQFQYDMRIDPRDNADILKRYVDFVKAETGHSKVNIICRCEGNVIVNAFLHEYGYSDLDGLIMYNSIASGSELADELYTNKVDLNPEAMNRFINTFLDTSPVLDFVKATVNLATFNGVLDEGLGFFMDIYDKISLNLMPRLIREIFGTCPGWWGMVSPEAYEDAKAFVLGTDNADGKYDKLIEKLDGYNEMKKTATDILKKAQADGVKVHIITKYGNQMYPCIENHDILGDGVVSLYKQSFNGATTSKLTDKLTDEYIQERINQGFGKYISADKMVDGSTAAFPEHTWYIKNLEHDSYPFSVEFMMVDLLNYKGYATVDSMTDKYTQYMYYEETEGTVLGGTKLEIVGILTPLTQENKDMTGDKTNTKSIFYVILNWLTALFNFITSLFKGNK